MPFASAEEAWFWFARCQRLRIEGGRFEPSQGSLSRPCDPDDIYRAVKDLNARRLINREHLRVLGHFGFRQSPPDPRLPEQQPETVLWREAVDRMETVLKQKGIVA